MRLQRYFDISQAADVHAFQEELIRFAADMDFGLVNAMMIVEHLGPERQVDAVSIGNMPQGFSDQFASVDDSARDPVWKRLKKLSVPFIYDQNLYVAEGAGDLWERQAPFGYHTGVSVALHLPGHRHFLLGVDRDRPLPPEEERLTRIMADLQLLAVHAQDAANRLLVLPDGHGALPRLTPRELEILRWTMEGKSAWAVGEILGVSVHTVNFHLRNAMKKLDCATKHQAVLKAISLSLL
jgi:DNA-binding CsgD family transcriptional regulator